LVAILRYKDKQITDLVHTVQAQAAQIATLVEKLNVLLPTASNSNQIDDLFRELRLAQQKANKAEQRVAALEEQEKTVARIAEQLVTADMTGASLEQKVAWVNERIQLAEEVRQLFPLANSGNQFKNLLRELRLAKQEADKAKQQGETGQQVGGHDQPPRISLKESDGYSFPLGSAELSGPFRVRLSSEIVTQILSIAERYQVSVVEVIGHTDETPLRRNGGTLDMHLIPFLRGENVQVVATDNVGLGMARAAAVLNALSGDARLSHLMFLPYSAGQVVLRGDRLSDGTDRSPNDERRRIEISLRKPR
jgi:flagellar motor protein MotB